MSEPVDKGPEVAAEEAPKRDDQDAAQLPDDHPLVKSLAAQKEQIKALKEKAQRLDQIEQSNKTEAEKAAEALAAAESRAAEAEARALRRDIALEHRLNKGDAALLDSMTDEEAMRSLAERLAAGSDKKHGNYVPREGNNPPAKPDEKRAFANFLTGNTA